MSKETAQGPEGAEVKKPEETIENTTETGANAHQSIDESKKPIPPEVYESTKNDMLKYKQKMREYEERLAQYDKEREEMENKKLEEQQKYQELYQKKNEELEKTKAQFRQTQITNELKLVALREGIRDVDDIRLIDLSQISFNEQTGQVDGVADAIKNLKEKKPYLFGSDTKPQPSVPAGNSVSQDGAGQVTKYEDLMANTALLKDYKTNHPAVYEKLRNDYIARTRKNY